MRVSIWWKVLWCSSALGFVAPAHVYGQSAPEWDEQGYSTYADFAFDTSMVRSYEHLFGLESYLQQKDLRLALYDIEGRPLRFEPPSAIGLGLGFSYRYLALSAAVNLLPLRQSAQLEATSFDFQSQVAGKRFLSFITAQLYKGMHSSYKDVVIADKPQEWLLNDMRVGIIGLNNLWALNPRYSFRGSVLRFQRMRYSVGTPVLGLETQYFHVGAADTTIYPRVIADAFSHPERTKYAVVNLGLGAGYAYTWRINDRLLLAGIGTLKLPFNMVFHSEGQGGRSAYLSSGLNACLWLRANYERERWSVSFHYIQNKTLIGRNLYENDMQVQTSMARLIFSRRFGINRNFKRQLKPVDAVLDLPLKILGIK